MNASSPMQPVVRRGRFKLYYADRHFTKPGLHVWTGPKRGHVRLLRDPHARRVAALVTLAPMLARIARDVARGVVSAWRNPA